MPLQSAPSLGGDSSKPLTHVCRYSRSANTRKRETCAKGFCFLESNVITQQELKSALHYDRATGYFRWRKSSHHTVQPWDIAGSVKRDGYRRIGLGHVTYSAHRLAWLYVTGEDPAHEIDHIDGNRDNNAITNLRVADRKQNSENLKTSAKNTSGFRGVTKTKDGRWQAQMGHKRKTLYLGVFDTPEQAAKVVRSKRAQLFTHDHGRAA